MKRVWVIDHDEEMNRAVGLMLKLLGCEVAAFYTSVLQHRRYSLAYART